VFYCCVCVDWMMMRIPSRIASHSVLGHCSLARLTTEHEIAQGEILTKLSELQPPIASDPLPASTSVSLPLLPSLSVRLPLAFAGALPRQAHCLEAE
jgi:hypothetical protein